MIKSINSQFIELSNLAFSKLDGASVSLEGSMEQVIFSLAEIEEKKDSMIKKILNTTQISSSILVTSEYVSATIQEQTEEFITITAATEGLKQLSSKFSNLTVKNEE